MACLWTGLLGLTLAVVSARDIDVKPVFTPDDKVSVIESQQQVYQTYLQVTGTPISQIHLQVADTGIAVVVKNSTISPEQVSCVLNTTASAPAQTVCYRFTFTVKGLFLGRTRTVFYEGNETSAAKVLPIDHQVTVIREPSVLSDVIKYTLAGIVALTTIAYGCTLNLDEVKELLKTPWPPIIGLSCQFVINPLVSYGIGKAYRLSPAMALGLFAFGCCPGGGNSNLWALILGGDVNLSIVMTLLSIFASFAMLPLWLYTLGRTLVSDNIDIPFLNIFTALLLLVVPCIIGILINKYAPRCAKIMRKAIKPVTIFVVLLFVTVGLVSMRYVFSLMGDWKVVLAGLSMPCAVYPASFLVAWIFRQPRRRILTIVIETAVQNSGTGLLLILTTFPQPDADIAAVMPLMATMFTPFPLILLLIGKTIRERCCVAAEEDKCKSNPEQKIPPLESNDKAVATLSVP